MNFYIHFSKYFLEVSPVFSYFNIYVSKIDEQFHLLIKYLLVFNCQSSNLIYFLLKTTLYKNDYLKLICRKMFSREHTQYSSFISQVRTPQSGKDNTSLSYQESSTSCVPKYTHIYFCFISFIFPLNPLTTPKPNWQFSQNYSSKIGKVGQLLQ